MSVLSRIKPNVIIGLGIAVQILLGILGDVLDWASFFSSTMTVAAGSVIAAAGLIMHFRCHAFHKKGHARSDAIDTLVSDGLFAHMRHPMYSSILLIVWGMYIAWNYRISLIAPLITTVLLILLAKEEEKFLLNSLGKPYEDYMKKVRFRFIPGLF